MQEYGKEMYRSNHYRVCHGRDEEKILMAQGWSDEMDRDRADYVVYTSGIPEDGAPEQKRGPGRPRKSE